MELPSSWDALRKQARKLEAQLDEQMISYRKFVASKVDGTESEVESGIDRSIKQLQLVIAQMQSWISAGGSEVFSHTVTRHQEILQDLTQEFHRLQSSLRAKQEHASLIEDFMEFDRSRLDLEEGGGSVEQGLLKEHASISRSTGQLPLLSPKIPLISPRKLKKLSILPHFITHQAVYLRPHLGDSVEHLFDETLLNKTPQQRMTSNQRAEVNPEGEALPPLPRFGGRKRKAPPTPGGSKVGKTSNFASASNSSAAAIMSTTSSAVVDNITTLSRTSPASTSQSCGVMTTSSSQALPSPTTNTRLSQGSASLGSVGNRIPRAPEGSTPRRPVYKDLNGKLLTVDHHARDSSPVAGLVQNNSILPLDADFYDKQTSAYLALLSAQSRYNVNAADHSLTKRLLRYEDYINGICDSLGCTRADSIIEQLTKLKADAEKGKDAFGRIAELQAELEKTREASSKIAGLQSSLDKAQAENVVAQATIDNIKFDKDCAVKELVEVNLGLAREKAAKEVAEGTLNKWRNDYNLAGRKMNALFDAIAPHMESCRPFRDEVRRRV